MRRLKSFATYSDSLREAYLSEPDDLTRLALADALLEEGRPQAASFVRWVLPFYYWHPLRCGDHRTDCIDRCERLVRSSDIGLQGDVGLGLLEIRRYHRRRPEVAWTWMHTRLFWGRESSRKGTVVAAMRCLLTQPEEAMDVLLTRARRKS